MKIFKSVHQYFQVDASIFLSQCIKNCWNGASKIWSRCIKFFGSRCIKKLKSVHEICFFAVGASKNSSWFFTIFKKGASNI